MAVYRIVEKKGWFKIYVRQTRWFGFWEYVGGAGSLESAREQLDTIAAEAEPWTVVEDRTI